MRLLIAYPEFPEFDTNSGSLRLFEIIKILLKQGHEIFFLARSKGKQNPKYKLALENLGIECAYEADILSFPDFLLKQLFEVTIFVHYKIYRKYFIHFRAILPKCHLILDTVDLHFIRAQAEADLFGDSHLQKKANQIFMEEKKAIANADSVWVVTALEKRILSQRKLKSEKSTYVVSTIHQVSTSNPSFEERQGIIFLGSYRHPPNVDAVHFFMKEIFPEFRKLLPDVSVTIAGSNPQPEILKYREMNNVFVTGFIEDHRSLLKNHRVGIAPLRYGAGMKGKIGEYFSCALPCVVTSTGAEGMELAEKGFIIANDPINFARSMARLYTDPQLWNDLSEGGLCYIKNNLDPKHVFSTLKTIMSSLEKNKRSPFANIETFRYLSRLWFKKYLRPWITSSAEDQ